MSAGLIRWCGLAAMLGGVLWPLWAAAVQGIGFGEPGSAAYERYELANRLLPLALLPVVVGCVGLHAAQRRNYGWLGAAGFAVALVGFALITVGSAGEFWLFSDEPYGQPSGRDVSWTLFLLGHPVLAVGTALFGAATARSRTFPSEAGMMFAVLGTCGALVPFIGAVIFAIPFAWLGYLMWAGRYEVGQQPARVA